MEENELTLEDYLAAIKRRKWGFFIPALLIFSLAVIVAFALPSSYKSTSTILIEEQEIPSDLVMSTITSYAEQRLQSINQRIMSSTRLLEIINRLDIYKKLRSKATIEEVVEKMRNDISLEYINAEVVDPHSGRPSTVTIAFTLAYESQEAPVVTQKVSNILASLFLEENLKERKRQAQETSAFLADELQKIEKRLNRNEKDIAIFRGANINTLPEMTQVNMQALNLVESTIARLIEQLRATRERKGELEADLANLSPKLQLENKNRIENLRLELNRLQTNFTDDYPDVINARQELARLEAQAADPQLLLTQKMPDNPAYITLSSRLAGVTSEIKSIENQLAEARKKEEELHKRLELTPKVEEEYNQFMVQRRNLQAQYDTLTQKLMGANVAYGLEEKQKGGKFTLIDPARLPEKPSKPNRLAIILIGFVLGVGAGIGIAALQEFSDQSIKNSVSLQLQTGFPVLTTIPQIITRADISRRRNRTIILIIILLGAFAAGLYVFHTWIMDLNVLWAKISRKM